MKPAEIVTAFFAAGAAADVDTLTSTGRIILVTEFRA
jgi:hypothetical protein